MSCLGEPPSFSVGAGVFFIGGLFGLVTGALVGQAATSPTTVTFR